MSKSYIEYRKTTRWKYRLEKGAGLDVSPWKLPNCSGAGGLIEIGGGRLLVRAGYAWDGPSGPTIDTKTFMRGSLFHDALYQLIRENQLADFYRKEADQIIRAVCLRDGMSRIRAWWVYHALRLGGGPAARTKRPFSLLVAPKQRS